MKIRDLLHPRTLGIVHLVRVQLVTCDAITIASIENLNERISILKKKEKPEQMHAIIRLQRE